MDQPILPAHVQTIVDINSCGTGNGHTPVYAVSLTSPGGQTGIELRKCGHCLMALLHTPAVLVNGRVATVRAV